MEPINHPFRKDNDLPNLHDHVPAVNLPGCILISIRWAFLASRKSHGFFH